MELISLVQVFLVLKIRSTIFEQSLSILRQKTIYYISQESDYKRNMNYHYKNVHFFRYFLITCKVIIVKNYYSKVIIVKN